MSRTSRRPIGSRPDIGSSRITSSGSLTSAWASPTRCTMPFEKRRIGTSAERSRPTSVEQLARALAAARRGPRPKSRPA